MRRVLYAAFALVFLAPNVGASPIVFEGGLTSGLVSYDGLGGGLVGSNIRIDTLTGYDTPLNDGSTVFLSHLLPLPPSFGGRLNFETGAFQSGSGSNLVFERGGSFTLTGSAASLGITDPTTVLFSGYFDDELEIMRESGNLFLRNLNGEGGLRGTLNPLITSYYGTPDLIYEGLFSVNFTTLGPLLLGNLTDGFTGTVTSTTGTIQAIPEPSSLALAGIAGLTGIGVTVFRSKRRRPWIKARPSCHGP